MEGFLENTKNTKNTKDHEGTRRVEPQISEKHRGAQRGQRDTEAGGVLAHAGLPECLYHKVHKEAQRTQRGVD